MTVIFLAFGKKNICPSAGANLGPLDYYPPLTHRATEEAMMGRLKSKYLNIVSYTYEFVYISVGGSQATNYI